MAASKGTLPLFDGPPPPPADRDQEIREIAFKVISASRRPPPLAQIMLSTAWIGIEPRATSEEVRAALHALVGQGIVNRKRRHMWAYTALKGGLA